MPRPLSLVDPKYHVIAAYVRLGHKYQIDHLVEEGIAYLKRYYPVKFEVMEKLGGHGPPKFRSIENIGVINLARLTNELSLIPSAMVRCCALDGEKIIRGFTLPTGVQEVLYSDDLAKCFNTSRRLGSCNVDITSHLFPLSPSPHCKSKSTCQALIIECSDPPIEEFDAVHPFVSWEHIFDVCCLACRKYHKKRHDKARRQQWLRLPDIVGVQVKDWPTTDI